MSITLTQGAMTTAQQLTERVEELKNALLSAHPQMPTMLRIIHQQLKSDPALTTTLSEDEIQVIVSGLKKITMTEIATVTAKSKTKSIKSIGVDDL